MRCALPFSLWKRPQASVLSEFLTIGSESYKYGCVSSIIPFQSLKRTGGAEMNIYIYIIQVKHSCT